MIELSIYRSIMAQSGKVFYPRGGEKEDDFGL